MQNLLFFTAFFICTSITMGCAAQRVPNKTTYNVLFIGNSLTFVNDLPGLVKHAAKKKGIEVTTRMIAQPNYALIDHLTDGLIQQEIRNHHFDFVVVQQGPSSQDEGRQMLFDAGETLGQLCRSNHARLAFFMVWPSRTYESTFAGVIENYKEAASRQKAILCPVGQVWKSYIDQTGHYDYYGPDGFHPSLHGSQVAAEVIVKSLFDQ